MHTWHIVEITEFSLTLLWQKFRENDVFTKELIKSLFDGIFFGESKCSVFSTLCTAVQCNLRIHKKTYFVTLRNVYKVCAFMRRETNIVKIRKTASIHTKMHKKKPNLNGAVFL